MIAEGTTADLAGKQGWFIDLPITKERMVVPNRFQGSSLIGTTRIPDSTDVCSPGGRGYIMAINPFTGARLAETFFDINRDGVFDDEDRSSGDDRGPGPEGMRRRRSTSRREVPTGLGIDKGAAGFKQDRTSGYASRSMTDGQVHEDGD